MTREQTSFVYGKILRLYASNRLSKQEVEATVDVWQEFLEKYDFDEVMAATMKAIERSPQWMPGAPMIVSMIKERTATFHKKDDEQEYRDTHCGKSREEWEAMIAWRNTPEYEKNTEQLKTKMENIISKRKAIG